jgi:ankyrin repeat protein
MLSTFKPVRRQIAFVLCTAMAKEFYRPDGVRMGYDPTTQEMIAKYGAPGATDNEGFDPHHDTVGPGIYGGIVLRDNFGEVVIGAQYQNHNPRPGPVYAGGGYTPMSKAVQEGTSALTLLLDAYPELVNDVSTGGATPLHQCGMSRQGERATAFIIEHGGNVEATDTYGYRPLHRMASNNLALGAEALLVAGADPNAKTAQGETPMSVARGSNARDVIRVLEKHLRKA